MGSCGSDREHVVPVSAHKNEVVFQLKELIAILRLVDENCRSRAYLARTKLKTIFLTRTTCLKHFASFFLCVYVSFFDSLMGRKGASSRYLIEYGFLLIRYEYGTQHTNI